MSHRTLLPCTAVLFALALPAVAQQRSENTPVETVRRVDPLSTAQEDSLGLDRRGLPENLVRELPQLANSHLLAGEPISIGPDWKATYDSAGVTFTPALGHLAPRTRSLQFRLESVRLGDVALEGLDLGALPQLDERGVAYRRTSALVERYDALPQGLEQSFVFDALPASGGDLVVTGRLSTGLQPVATDGADVLRFEEPGFGGVRIDGLVGIDAAGRRVAGSLQQIDDRLELRLPASFVATAELPLVLDPLFGAEFQATTSAVDASQSDVAFGSSAFNEYAIVYSRFYSATDPDITALTVSESGPFGLLPVAIEATVGTFDQEPSVAYNVGAQSWAVAWQRASTPGATNSVLLSSFEVANGTVQPLITIGTGEAPDVGGEIVTGFSHVVVAWDDLTGINATSVQIFENAAPLIWATAALSTSPSAHEPAISKSGGSGGRYAAVWTLDFGSDRDLRFRDVNYLATTIGSEGVLTSIGPDEAAPDVAGDGVEFLMVYGREASAGNGDSDIVAHKLVYDFGLATLVLDPTEILVEAEAFDDERMPAVGLSGDEYVVAWLDQFSGGSPYDVYYASVSKTFCDVCEPTQLVSTATATYTGVEIGTRLDGADANGATAMIAYDRENGFANNEVYCHAWEESDGNAVVNLGGKCGALSTHTLTGDTSIGSPLLTSQVFTNDLSATLGILNVGAAGPAFFCGPCVWQPLKTTYFVGLAPSGGTQFAQQSLSIPCRPELAGKTAYLQWTLLLTSGSPCSLSPNIETSDRLSLTLDF